MKKKMITLAIGATLVTGCATDGDTKTTSSHRGHTMTNTTAEAPTKTVNDFRAMAARHRVVLELPTYETTPAQLQATVDATIDRADTRLTRLAQQNLARVNFDSTILEYDHIKWEFFNVLNRMYVIQNTSTDAEVRAAATEAVKQMTNWAVGVEYRQDVYEVCRAFSDLYEAERRPRLRGEMLKLYTETMRDYKRAGLSLDPTQRDEVERLRKELADLSTDFDSNITNASVTVYFEPGELDGVPQSWLDRTETGDGRHGFRSTVTPHFMAIMQNATSEETRRRMKESRYTVAQEENTEILQEIVRLRDEVARLLSYDSWADYRIEPKMAGDLKTAMDFENRLVEGLEPKFRAEVEAMRALKVADTGDPNAQIEMWDWRFYANKIKKENYSVDSEALRAYFPLDACIGGMFDIYQKIFSLRFDRIDPGFVWEESVTTYVVSDAASDEPLGVFYLDMFPREGKYNHFAQFGIIDGRELPNGKYQRPVVALVCNFTSPTEDMPSLITHGELETLFHEFGHAMHSILTQAKTGRFSGTSVPRDFVEAPSQMLEAWVWDTTVLDTFAADWRDPSKKIDPSVLKRMEEARLATVATTYRRQLAFGLADLRIHAPGSYKDVKATINDTMGEIFFAPPAGSHFAAYWGHLTGYDAGYYGYAWADAIAADMATAFEEAPDRFMSVAVGMRLRNEIYAVGGARPAEESVELFLGRPRSLKPFLQNIGIQD